MEVWFIYAETGGIQHREFLLQGSGEHQDSKSVSFRLVYAGAWGSLGSRMLGFGVHPPLCIYTYVGVFPNMGCSNVRPKPLEFIIVII